MGTRGISMYQNERFTKTGTIEKGELKYLIPGLSLKATYRGGDAAINAAGTVVLADLELTDIVVSPHSTSQIARHAASRIEDSESILETGLHFLIAGTGLLVSSQGELFDVAKHKAKLGHARLPLYGSFTRDGSRLLTMPAPLDFLTERGNTIKSYNLEDLPGREAVYGMHAQLIGNQTLRERKEYALEDARSLPRQVQATAAKMKRFTRGE